MQCICTMYYFCCLVFFVDIVLKKDFFPKCVTAQIALHHFFISPFLPSLPLSPLVHLSCRLLTEFCTVVRLPTSLYASYCLQLLL